MNILFIGDIFGRTGIRAIRSKLAEIKKKHDIDLTIVNAENTTNCRGLSICDYNRLVEEGVDVITMGNHTWKQKDYADVLAMNKIIRPLNLNSGCVLSRIGKGSIVVEVNNKKVRVTNVLGSSIYKIKTPNEFTNPFICLDDLIEETEGTHDIHIVDFHAETTSEKNCALICLKGKISALVGTHTHVQTNDVKIVNNTAYITDVGMTGPTSGIIGADPSSLIDLFYERSNFFRLNEFIDSKFQISYIIIRINDDTNEVVWINNFIEYE